MDGVGQLEASSSSQYCNKLTFFQTSIDVSNRIRDSNYIFGLMRKVIKNVRPQYLILAVIDNCPQYKQAS